jgi:hypothetical protein
MYDYDDYDDGGLPAYAVETPKTPAPAPPAGEDPPECPICGVVKLNARCWGCGYDDTPASPTPPETITFFEDVPEETPKPTPLVVDTSAVPNARYCYVTGSAGTGKTTIMRAWAQEHPGAVLCATTGIAAVNLGDAVTVNSLLGYFDTASLRENYLHNFLQNRLRKLRTGGLTRIILDEVSMMEADALTLLVRALEEVNNESAVLVGDEPEMGLTLVGDFLQLPPIGAKETKEDGTAKRRVEKAKYAFEAPEWAEHFEPNVVRLTKIHRQADLGFVAALQALRKREALEALEVLRSCLRRSGDPHFPGTTIYAKNAEVDRHNLLRLRELTTAPVLYTSTRQGKERPEWKNIPATLALKPGALVMVLSNFYDNLGGDRELVAANGDLAEYLGPGASSSTDQPTQRSAQVKLRRNERVVTIPMVEAEFRKPTGDRKQPWEVVGTITYMPLRLAYATTVHKSQGLSLDEVQLNIADPFWAAPAMLYVGVSRARTLAGLQIVGTMEQLRAKTNFDPRVERWR